jgi:HEAT repeat protein
LAALTAALRDRDAYMRKRATEALGKLGRGTDDVVASLLIALRDEYAEVRGSAAEALGKLGKASDRVMAELTKALKSRSAWTVAETVMVLSKLGVADEWTIQTLAGLLRDRRGLLSRFFGPKMGESVFVDGRYAPAYDFVFDALWELAGRTAD